MDILCGDLILNFLVLLSDYPFLLFRCELIVQIYRECEHTLCFHILLDMFDPTDQHPSVATPSKTQVGVEGAIGGIRVFTTLS